MGNIRFLEHLASVLNKVFDTDSFKLNDEGLIQVYSDELKIGVHSIVGDPRHVGELSMSDLFSRIEKAVDAIAESRDIDRLIIVSTNNEEELITGFIDFLRSKKSVRQAIEFWGWQTIQKIFEHFPLQGSDRPQIGDEQHLNFVPTANIYQLFGIDQVLKQIDQAIDSSLTPVVIHNPLSGTGRTAILLAYAFHYDFQKKFDHYAFVNVCGNLKLDFVRSFNGKIGFVYNQLVSLDDNLLHLIDMLNQIEGRNLLLIDGIKDVEQSVDLMFIASKLKWRILATSRFRIFSYENIYLQHPDKQSAAKIFTYYFKDLEVNDTVLRLLDKVAYHPFSIVFMAKFLSHFIDNVSVDQLVGMLEEKDKRIYRLGDYIDKSLSRNQILLVRALLKYIISIFDYQAHGFQDLEKQIFMLSSVLPDCYTTFSTLQEILGVEDKDQFSDTVLMILSKGWLDADKDRFRVPGLVKAVLHKKFKPSPLKLRRYIDFLFERLSRPTGEALQWLDYAQSLIKRVVKLNLDIANLALLLAHHYDNLKLEKQAIGNYEYAGFIIEQVYNETSDPGLLDALARVWARVGRTERALFYTDMIINQLENQEDHGEELVFWYQFAARLYAKIGDYEKAISYADNALDTATMIFDREDPRLLEVELFHRRLSEEFNHIFQDNEKRQWLKRFFI